MLPRVVFALPWVVKSRLLTDGGPHRRRQRRRFAFGVVSTGRNLSRHSRL